MKLLAAILLLATSTCFAQISNGGAPLFGSVPVAVSADRDYILIPLLHSDSISIATAFGGPDMVIQEMTSGQGGQSYGGGYGQSMGNQGYGNQSYSNTQNSYGFGGTRSRGRNAQN